MKNMNHYLNKQLADPVFAEEFKALEPDYEIIRELIRTRNEQHLTQKELADKIGVQQSNISRLESGSYNPSISLLKKVAGGLGKELHIEFR